VGREIARTVPRGTLTRTLRTEAVPGVSAPSTAVHGGAAPGVPLALSDIAFCAPRHTSRTPSCHCSSIAQPHLPRSPHNHTRPPAPLSDAMPHVSIPSAAPADRHDRFHYPQHHRLTSRAIPVAQYRVQSWCSGRGATTRLYTVLPTMATQCCTWHAASAAWTARVRCWMQERGRMDVIDVAGGPLIWCVLFCSTLSWSGRESCNVCALCAGVHRVWRSHVHRPSPHRTADCSGAVGPPPRRRAGVLRWRVAVIGGVRELGGGGVVFALRLSMAAAGSRWRVRTVQWW